MKRNYLFALICFFLVWIDYLNAQTIPNYDFEDWYTDSNSNELPVDWTTSESILSGSVLKNPNAFHGDFDMLLASQVSTAWAETGFPLSFHPQYFHGYYKGFQFPTDTIFINVYLYFNGQRVDSGQWIHPDVDDTSYQLLTIPISQFATQVDSGSIHIFCVADHIWAISATLRIDYLYFDDDISIGEIANDLNLIVSPNPASNSFTVYWEQPFTSISLFNLLGKRMFHQSFVPKKEIEVDISEFPAGLYLVEVADSKTKVTEKFIKQ